jgi:thioredoxin-related protein
MPRTPLASALALLLSLAVCPAVNQAMAADPAALPPPTGVEEPKVVPIKGDDGIYRQPWFQESFLDLREDAAEARSQGLRFAVIFEQRGCIYCTRMHTEVLALKYINDYVRTNFRIVQLDLWGGREVTDFDGTKMPEKKLAERWGVMFTPTIVFLKDDLDAMPGQWGPSLEAARMQLGIGPGTFYDMFVWIRHKVYESDRNFQRFHIARVAEREALAKTPAAKSSLD